jgi:hypothetical protein
MKFGILLGLFILIIIPISGSTQSVGSINLDTNEISLDNDFNATLEYKPMKFWRANGQIFKVTDSAIFPQSTMGIDGSLKNLGIAWITWIIEIGGKETAALALFERGRISNFTRIDGYYEEIYFQGLGEDLMVILSSKTRTYVKYYSTAENQFTYTLNFNSTKHNVLIEDNDLSIYFLLNGTIPSMAYFRGLQVFIVETNVTLISSLGNTGIFQDQNNSMFLYSDGQLINLPEEITNKSEIGHILMQPAVFDIETKKIWVSNIMLDLPSNTEAIYKIGLRSSLIRTMNNSIYELFFDKWILISDYEDDLVFQDFSIIDIELYLGTVPSNGLQLVTHGEDNDGDFAPDTLESYFATDPDNYDSDQDTIPDGIEINNGLNPLIDDRRGDYDGDKLNNLDEINLNLDPKAKDSDYGGAFDGWELKYGFDPTSFLDDRIDPDSDGVSNHIESQWDSNPFEIDSDFDEMPDGWEILYNLDPMDPTNAHEDADGDGRSNLEEYQMGSDPLLADQRPLFDDLGWWILIIITIQIPLVYWIMRRSIAPELFSSNKDR